MASEQAARRPPAAARRPPAAARQTGAFRASPSWSRV